MKTLLSLILLVTAGSSFSSAKLHNFEDVANKLEIPLLVGKTVFKNLEGKTQKGQRCRLRVEMGLETDHNSSQTPNTYMNVYLNFVRSSDRNFGDRWSTQKFSSENLLRPYYATSKFEILENEIRGYSEVLLKAQKGRKDFIAFKLDVLGEIRSVEYRSNRTYQFQSKKRVTCFF